ncbi:hypothetical protein JRQ81_011046 [Phrynocephalus forsythii]|uniref:Uncharacterized protein n=1 Tax=Phrynocephalus forsythii TaxID=171643 RepID=A0A9Q0Y2L2_9SAUR|nr:hypothetical protein JRQ81_011046 [Phrynocephalus forsythii]
MTREIPLCSPLAPQQASPQRRGLGAQTQTFLPSPSREAPVALGELLGWLSQVSESWTSSRGGLEAGAPWQRCWTPIPTTFPGAVDLVPPWLGERGAALRSRANLSPPLAAAVEQSAVSASATSPFYVACAVSQWKTREWSSAQARAAAGPWGLGRRNGCSSCPGEMQWAPRPQGEEPPCRRQAGRQAGAPERRVASRPIPELPELV